MPQVMNRVKNYEDQSQMKMVTDTLSSVQNEEMAIVMEDTYTQKSAMSPEQRKAKKNEDVSLENLFNEVLESKGELNNVSIEKLKYNELKIDGLSNLTLHTFLLKAEALGKNITYTKSLRVRISD